MNIHFIVMGVCDGVKRGSKCEAAGRVEVLAGGEKMYERLCSTLIKGYISIFLLRVLYVWFRNEEGVCGRRTSLLLVAIILETVRPIKLNVFYYYRYPRGGARAVSY